MTERYPRIYRNDIIADMETIPMPVTGGRLESRSKFTAPGFDYEATEKIDTNEIRRRLHLGELATQGIYDRQDELNTVLPPEAHRPIRQNSPESHVDRINVAAIRENLGLSAVRSTVSNDLRQTSMHVDGVKPGEVSSDSRARRAALMRNARRTKLA
jgi:hypothetical protein